MEVVSMSRYPTASLIMSMIIFGTIGVFAVEGGLSSIATVFWRCIFASLFLTGWCFARGLLPDPSFSRSLALRAAFGGLCNIGSSVALFGAFQVVTISTATIVYHVQPFFVVLIGVTFLKERVEPFQVAWITIAFVGVVLATGVFSSDGALDLTWAGGVGLSVLAALLYAIGTILGKELGDQRPEITTLIQTVVGFILLAPFANVSQHVPMQSWGWLIGLGVIHTGIAYVLMYSAYPRLSTPVIGVLAFIYPVVAILLDWLFYGKRIGWWQAAGISLIGLATMGVRLGWRVPRPPRSVA